MNDSSNPAIALQSNVPNSETPQRKGLKVRKKLQFEDIKCVVPKQTTI